MTYFHECIKKIKSHGNVDFIRIRYSGNSIVLRLVDDSDETVRLITRLRKKFRHMFATNFNITEERTKKWIQESLKNDDWIQFIVYVNDKRIGTIGNTIYDEKTNSSELDNMMRDPDNKYPGVMNIVEKVYLKWMFDGLLLDKITGWLFSDNYKALNSHLRCGFVITGVIPTKRKYTEEGWIWEKSKLCSEDEFGERYYHTIELTKENLMKNFGCIEFEILI